MITEDVKCPPKNEWIDRRYFMYTLKDSILVKAGQCLDFALYIQHQPGNESELYRITSNLGPTKKDNEDI